MNAVQSSMSQTSGKANEKGWGLSVCQICFFSLDLFDRTFLACLRKCMEEWKLSFQKIKTCMDYFFLFLRMFFFKYYIYSYLTRVVDSLMELKGSQLGIEEQYIYLDPKISSTTNVPRKTTPFREAIVFVIGGGNYIEYQNILDHFKVCF